MENKPKILIMERLEEVEEVLADYIHQNFHDSEVTLLTHIDRLPQAEIIEAIKACDIILAQSIFDTVYDGIDGIQSFLNMIKLFYAVPELRKPAYIIHTTNKLLYTLNYQLPVAEEKMLREILMNGYELYNVHYGEFAGDTKPGSFFKAKTIKIFDTIKMWYDEKNRMIWDEHQHFIPLTTKNFFKLQPIYMESVPKPEKKHKYSHLTGTDVKILEEMLSEVYQIMEENIDDLKNKRGWVPDEEEKNSLLSEKKARLEVLDKMGVESFR